MLFSFCAFTTKGHVVNYAGGLPQGALLTNYGYVQEWNYFVKAVGDSYVTFKHNEEASEFSIFFIKAAERDTSVKVWMMDYNGGVKEEFDTTWKEGEYFLRFENIPEGVSLVSLSINGNFTFYKVISSNPYCRYYRAIGSSLIIGAAVFILLMVLFKFGVFSRLGIIWNKVVGWIKERQEVLKHELVICLIGLAGSVLAAVLVEYILSIISIENIEKRIEFNHKTVAVFFLFFFYVFFMVLNRKRLAKYLAFFGAFTVLVVGAAYAFLETPITGISWDDQIHYSSANYYSHFIDMEKSVAEDSMVYGYELTYFDKENCEAVAGMFDTLYREKYFYRIVGFEPSLKGLVYLPNSMGMLLAKVLHLTFRYNIYLARFMMAVFCAVMCFIAVRILDYGKIVVILMALTPTNAFLAGNITYDPWVTMWIVLGFAVLFHEMQSEEKIRLRNVILMAVSFYLASIVKQVYCVLAIPALFMPGRKFKTVKDKWGYRALMAGAMLVTFLPMVFVRLFRASGGDMRGGAEVSTSGQIDYIMAQPWEFVRTLWNFLKDYLNPLKFSGLNSCIDLVGYNRVAGVTGLVLVLIFGGALLCHGDRKGSFPVWFRAGMLLMYVGVGTICATAMYVSFTPVGADVVLGCQGRYLIPVLFPTLFVLTRIPVKERVVEKIKEENLYMVLMTAMVAVNLWALMKVYVMWY